MGKRVVNDEQLLDKTGKSRRRFVKRVIVGTAFAAPLIASFPMNGLKADSARSIGCSNQDCSSLPPLQRLFCVIEHFISRLFGNC